MINIENVNVVGFEEAIRGMRNPMNSWALSDSTFAEKVILGDADLTLMNKLSQAGSDHSKYMRYITVALDITAPRYWWSEFDTYKVGTVSNSTSTMHKIHSKEFKFEDFSFEHLNTNSRMWLKGLLFELNSNRRKFIDTNDKDYWWQMIQLLPASYNQKRTILLNYQVLKAMYKGRRNHKLDEWQTFCDWIEELPYFKYTIGAGTDGK